MSGPRCQSFFKLSSAFFKLSPIFLQASLQAFFNLSSSFLQPSIECRSFLQAFFKLSSENLEQKWLCDSSVVSGAPGFRVSGFQGFEGEMEGSVLRGGRGRGLFFCQIICPKAFDFSPKSSNLVQNPPWKMGFEGTKMHRISPGIQ